MIDLRSDTLTLPSKEMLESILYAELGDDGRVGHDGRGEDKTVNQLEDLAAEITMKEAALLFPTGTLGNTVAILSQCREGDPILVHESQHILVTEKFVFDERYGRLKPIIYKMNSNITPDIDMIDDLFNQSGSKLLCLENTHNFLGGYCIPIEEMKNLRKVADKYNAKIHLDGARLFHAASALKVPVKEITMYVDTVMFCISKGLGAPIGSLVCGTREMVEKMRSLRKNFGGGMRQAGIIASPGIYALKYNVNCLENDIENSKYVYNKLSGKLNKISMQQEVQSNIIVLDLSDTNISPAKFCEIAEEKGLLIRPSSKHTVRLVFYKGIDRLAAEEAAEIILALDKII